MTAFDRKQTCFDNVATLIHEAQNSGYVPDAKVLQANLDMSRLLIAARHADAAEAQVEATERLERKLAELVLMYGMKESR